LQYGALPYRFTKSGAREILLVTTRQTKRWIIPVLLFVAIMAFESDYTHFTRVAFFGTGGASAQTVTLGFQISRSEH